MKERVKQMLLWSERYTKTDMLYLAKGGFWLTLGKTIATLSAFLLSIAFANWLPKEVYGTYQYVLSLVGFFTVATLINVNASLMRSVAKGFEGNFLPAMYTRMRWGVLGGIGSLVTAAYYYVNGNRVLAISFGIAAVFIPIMEPMGIFGDFLKGKKLFKLSSKFQMAARLISLLAMGTVLYFTNNIFYVLLGYFVPRMLIRFFSHIYVLVKVDRNRKKDKDLITYGKHLSAMSILQTLAEQLDKILIFHFLGASELAVYYFATAPAGQIKSLFSSIKTLAFPKFSHGAIADIKRTLPEKIIRMQFGLVLPIILIYVFFAPLVFSAFFPQYMEAVYFSQIFILTLLFFPKGIISSALVAQKKTRALYMLKTITPIIRTVILFVAVIYFGLPGMIAGGVISAAIIYVLYYYFFKRM